MHKRHSRIYFKILEVGENHIIEQAVQTKSAAKNYITAKELAGR